MELLLSLALFVMLTMNLGGVKEERLDLMRAWHNLPGYRSNQLTSAKGEMSPNLYCLNIYLKKRVVLWLKPGFF